MIKKAGITLPTPAQLNNGNSLRSVDKLIPNALYRFDIIIANLLPELPNMNINGSIANNNVVAPNG